jgi:serine/threonine-protein kinase
MTAAIRQTIVRRRTPEVTRRPAASVVIGGHWLATRLVVQRDDVALYRARTTDELGPGCYVVKLVRRPSPGAPVAVAGLRREAEAAAAVCNPHVTSVLADGLGSSEPHLVLPYLEGVSLRGLLDALDADPQAAWPARLPVATALGVARQVADALASLHTAGWLHDQVRPQHIVISPQGHAMLIDLTQARRLGATESRVKGAAICAPQYAAPEHFAASTLTAAVDIYSLGTTLYEMLTGVLPFGACSRLELAHAHRTRRPPELRDLSPNVTTEVEALVFQMLAKEPLRRPAASEAVRRLAELEIEELSLLVNSPPNPAVAPGNSIPTPLSAGTSPTARAAPSHRGSTGR